MRFEIAASARTYPVPGLPGGYQIENAGLALACAAQLAEFGLDEAARDAGLERVQWRGRLQRLGDGRLARMVPPGWELWLDGGHNAAAGRALAEVARGWCDRPLYLVYGMLNTKSARDFVRPLAPLAHSLHAVGIPGVEASLSAEEAAAEAAAAGIQARVGADVGGAIRDIVAGAPRDAPPGRILICGSLYLAGTVLADNAPADCPKKNPAG